MSAMAHLTRKTSDSVSWEFKLTLSLVRVVICMAQPKTEAQLAVTLFLILRQSLVRQLAS